MTHQSSSQGAALIILALGIAGAGCAAPDRQDAGVNVRIDSGHETEHDAGPCASAAVGAPANDPFRRARSTEDLPDDAPGKYQFHLLYVEPSDRVASPALDVDGTVRRTVTAFNTWFASRTGGSALRFDTCGGVLDVTSVKLPAPHTSHALASGVGYSPSEPSTLLQRLIQLLEPRFNEPKKLYFISWDGAMLGACGGSPHPPELVRKFLAMFVGGLYRSTYVVSPTAAGSTSLDVYSTALLPCPRLRSARRWAARR